MQITGKIGNRHHWVSQTILEEFKDGAGKLHVYDLIKHEWKSSHTGKKHVCSSPNFNGMRVGGQNQITLEGEISRLENAIPEIRTLLQDAARRKSDVRLGKRLHESLTKLLTCQRLGSISGKANLARQAIERINLQIDKRDTVQLQKEWGITGAEIFNYIAKGKGAVPVGQGWVQMLYQQAFRQAAPSTMAGYQLYHWAVGVPKRPFPISDQMPAEDEDENERTLALPLAPDLVLLGRTRKNAPNGTDIVKWTDLDRADEDKLRGIICGAGILEIVSSQEDPEIPKLHAKMSGHYWPKIQRPDWVLAAGREEATDMELTMIEQQRYNALLRTRLREKAVIRDAEKGQPIHNFRVYHPKQRNGLASTTNSTKRERARTANTQKRRP